MSASTAEVQTDFASILGGCRAIAEPGACAAFAVDGMAPKVVAYPASAEEAAEALRCAAVHNLAVIPIRNGTKVGIGATPRRYDVALSLKDMNQVWYYEPDDLVVSVEPGMKFGDLQHFLARHGLWIPLDPGLSERASVGGILAANAAGPLRLRYGGPRDIILGMRIATTDGRIVKTGGRVVKNVAGYDLAKLLIGSYGTLGVIVEATFKLYPQVINRASWMIDPRSLAAARDIRRELLGSPLSPMRMVLVNAEAWRFVGGPLRETGTAGVSESGLTVLIEAGGSDRVIGRYADELGSLAAKHGAELLQVEDEPAKETWERVADFAMVDLQEDEQGVSLKAALPITSAEEFLEVAGREAQAAGFKAAGLVQLGVGVVEVRLGGSGTRDSESHTPSPALIETLRRDAKRLGGSLVVTRYRAPAKPAIDVWGPPGDDFQVMAKMKAAWDPRSTLSPGRFVGGL